MGADPRVDPWNMDCMGKDATYEPEGMTVTRGEAPRGSALMAAMLVALMVSALAFAGVTVSSSALRGAGDTWEASQTLYTAEAGINASIREITLGTDPDGDGPGTLPSRSLGQSGSYQVVATPSGADAYTIVSTGSFGGGTHRIEVRIGRASTPISYDGRAAIVSNGPVTTSGSITVDGRDWAQDNSGVIGAGVHGISSRAGIAVDGASKVGGNGIAPIQNADEYDGVYEETAAWGDGADDDGDGLPDEEALDGIDDDGDGQVDEDTSGYALNPDAALGLAPGTLLAAAQAAGTYFATQASFEAFVAAHQGNVPGGKTIYLDFSQLNPCDFGSSLNTKPSILVQHNAAGNANMKNLHGSFKGLILADTVTHINGTAMILGAVMSFAPYSTGNVYGNGSAAVRFSSAVLNNLPAVSASGAAWQITAWRQLP